MFSCKNDPGPGPVILLISGRAWEADFVAICDDPGPERYRRCLPAGHPQLSIDQLTDRVCVSRACPFTESFRGPW